MNPLRHAVAAAFALVLSIPCHAQDAQSQRLRFNHLTVEDGLSNTWVRSTLTDHRGFLWVATRDGLNRYDGHTFKVYRHDPRDAHTLVSSQVWALFEDSQRRLWVGAEGLHLYDREQDRFERYLPGPEPGAARLSVIRVIREDRQGQLWLATEDGLYRFDPVRRTAAVFRHDPRDPGSLSDNGALALVLDRSGQLWVGTRGGLDCYDARTGKFTHQLRGPNDPPQLRNANVETMYQDDSGTLWLGTIGQGLIRVDPSNGQVKQYLPDPHDPTSISVDRILSLTGDGRTQVYVGSEGINVLDTRTEKFTRHLPDPDEPTSLSSSATIWSLRLDDQGVLWIGTFNSGVDYVLPLAQQFGLIRARRGGLSDPHVMAVLEDHLGDLWVGTDGGGLNHIDRSTGRFTYYRRDPLNPKGLSANAVLALREDAQHRIWIGTWTGGLQRLDPLTGRFATYRHDPVPSNPFAVNSFWTVIEDSRGEILAGTASNGVQILDRKTGRFTPLATRYPGVATGTVTFIVEDPQGNLWLGLGAPGEAGADYVDRRTGQVTRYRHDPKDPGSLAEGDVFSIFVDSRGNAWLGTAGGGLDCMDAKTRQLRHYTTAQGLPADHIGDILEDKSGNVWISTTRGLAKLVDGVRLPEQPRFLRFDVHDGLQGDEFRHGAAFMSQRGEMFFGGQRGLNYFFPDRVQQNPHKPPVVLTDFRIFNRSVGIGIPGSPLTKAITETSELTLSYQHSVVTFEFAALNFVLPQKNQYAYKLEGFDATWNEVGGQRSATYTNLPHGTFTLRVRGSNNDGVWNDEGVSLRIHVTPPFWRTRWFLAAVALALVGAAAGTHRLRVRQHIRAERALQKRVTTALADIKTLRGLLPICAWCKKVRDDSGYWSRIEEYVSEHTQAEFSHGICPECRTKLRPQAGKTR
jgi:ligand-binding sensor domain-containing protein